MMTKPAKKWGILVRWWPALVVLAAPVWIVAGGESRVSDPDPQRFAEAIEGFAHWDAKNAWPDDPILFVGSSSIRMWATREAFPDWPVVNRGFGGAHISDVNHYFDRVVKPYAPRVIVFYCGDNDIAAGKSPEQVLTAYRDFTKRVRDLAAETQIIYLPIKPSISRWKHWPAMQEANALIRAFIEQDASHTYVDVATPMLDDNGEPRKELLISDGLHLSEEGYRLWNVTLRPHVNSIIQPVPRP
jgi:lysophospholipase L1-like esterase